MPLTEPKNAPTKSSGTQSRKHSSRRSNSSYEREYAPYQQRRSPLRRLMRKLARVPKVMLTPWRIFNNVLNHWKLGDLAFGKLYRVRQLMRAMLRFETSSSFVSSDQDSEEALACDWPSAKTMANPLWWAVWSGQFLARWFLSRPFLQMTLSIPGVIVVFAFVSAAIVGGATSTSQLTGKYRQLMIAAAENNNFDEARILGNAAIQRSPRSAKLIYDRGIVEDMADEISLAKPFMLYGAKELESVDAALWLAEHVGDRNQIARWTDQQQSEYGEWLELVLKSQPHNTTVRKAFADLRRIQGSFHDARELLLPLTSSDSDANYLVVILEKELGLVDQARERAKNMLETQLSVLEDVPAKLDMRLQSASLLVFLEETGAAIELLSSGLAHAQTPHEANRLRRAIADGHVLAAEKLAKSDTSPRGLMKRFEQLRLAVQSDPNSIAVLNAVTNACTDVSISNNRELEVLKEAIVQGISPDASHFILGTLALNEGNIDVAMQHLEIAAEKNPNLPGLLNNLAYAMYRKPGADLEQALNLVDAAVRTSPNNAYARETRGQILVKLKRWSEAISDLEYALGTRELRTLVRPSLAVAYEEIGQPEVAKRHRYLAQKEAS